MADKTTQAQYEKDRAAALADKAAQDNARSAQKKRDAAKAAAAALKTREDQIRETNIKPAQIEIKSLEVQIAIRERKWNDEYRIRKPLDAADVTYLENNPDFGSKGTQVLKNQVKQYKDRIAKANQDIANLEKKRKEQLLIAAGKDPKDPKEKKKKEKYSDGSNTQGNGETPVTFTSNYQYNAPMVKSAYFASDKGPSGSLVGITNDGNFVDAGAYKDAMDAWKGTTGGRGTIQMDRKWVNAASASASANATSLDPQMYGFKFLYNPKEVSMAWGMMQVMDPSFEASGQDAFQVISAGLLSSTVTLTILINRIGDFSYINKDGFNKGFGSFSGAANDSVGDFRESQGITLSNPYPENVSNDEAIEIYNKGTMYDIEYLFKTINGPHATFISQLNGKTADRGWMRPSTVELHLGAGMRYRVRIANFAVTHSIFNSRMVPILSSVQLTMARFNDGPTGVTASATTYPSGSSKNGAPPGIGKGW